MGSAKRARAVVNHFLTHIGISGEYTAVDAQMTRPALLFYLHVHALRAFRAIAYYTQYCLLCTYRTCQLEGQPVRVEIGAQVHADARAARQADGQSQQPRHGDFLYHVLPV